ncbi:unnamed protein product [Danaus chrysippus]|uniref:Uncharacterized protein n=2 Tax=Danaus TaxID=13036 RepID=A0A212FEH5_DANPL|nr:uncharacterized protein LOC116769663 isoform X2 [Danaus plexippus]OWR52141.1 hypothetical protein KGM_203224 [Danaus plexippus plexippus]CAG9562511.1 unnamed protein product [Danaus chrysippus]
MSCGAECLSLGPPPDSIVHMPPPPLPAFLANIANLTPPCRAAKCPPVHNTEDNALFPGVEYHELPRHEPAGNDDTWFLVLITCCVAVLCIAALLALFLLKCREGRGCKAGATKAPTLYGTALDSRVLWAALTPRGTRHFVADTYPHDETEDHHYECVEPLYKLAPPDLAITRHFNVEYEDPALIESYDRTDYFRGETIRRGNRPLVSSPTRIERPNLPPLNLQPRTLRCAPHSRRVSDANNPEKSAI